MNTSRKSATKTTEIVEVVDVIFGERGATEFVNIASADGRVFGSTRPEILALANCHRDASHLQLTWHLQIKGRFENLLIDSLELPDEPYEDGAAVGRRPGPPGPAFSAELTARAADIAERLTQHHAAVVQKVAPPQSYDARMRRFVALIPILVRVFETGGQSLDALADLGDILGIDGLAALGLLATTKAGEAIKSEPARLDEIDFDADLPWDDAGSGARVRDGDGVVTF
jgi:hypothetical protein